MGRDMVPSSQKFTRKANIIMSNGVYWLKKLWNWVETQKFVGTIRLPEPGWAMIKSLLDWGNSGWNWRPVAAFPDSCWHPLRTRWYSVRNKNGSSRAAQAPTTMPTMPMKQQLRKNMVQWAVELDKGMFSSLLEGKMVEDVIVTGIQEGAGRTGAAFVVAIW